MEKKETLETVEYSDLLNMVESRMPPNDTKPLSAEDIIKHAEFIVAQVRYK